jgi:hypothetical protein
MMSTTEPTISLQLDGGHRAFQPGETLAGEWRIATFVPGEPQAVELSVLWHTEGKGDEDLAVHFFERFDATADTAVDFRQPRRFSTVLPNSPLSYEGVIVKIRWCVRARMFLSRSRQVVEEQPFRLGSVPAAQAVL